METLTQTSAPRELLLEAAGRLLREGGFTALSTRRVAEKAGVPLSQIHYHFGSRQNLVLALLEWENAKLLGRQSEMFVSEISLSRKWELACDYLEEDLASGYVRVLHEMIAAGLSDPALAVSVRTQIDAWYQLLCRVSREAAEEHGGIGPFTVDELALLIGSAFLGIESLLLIDAADARRIGLTALRKLGYLIAQAEERSDG